MEVSNMTSLIQKNSELINKNHDQINEINQKIAVLGNDVKWIKINTDRRT